MSFQATEWVRHKRVEQRMLRRRSMRIEEREREKKGFQIEFVFNSNRNEIVTRKNAPRCWVSELVEKTENSINEWEWRQNNENSSRFFCLHRNFT